ncbi:hypothetical protein ACFL6N_00380 [Thermodesulfobacteriota bacterium]
MIDIYIGRPPTLNRHFEDVTPAVQNEVRHALRVARNRKTDRRKHTRDRRQSKNEDVVVDLSYRPERRTSLDRRQNFFFLDQRLKKKHQRKNSYDRRKLVNYGIRVTLESVMDRRSHHDRRHHS